MSNARGLTHMATAALLAVALAACAEASPEPSIPGAVPDPTVDQPGHDLADGETFAWVMGLTGDGFMLDPAEMLSGEEARQAATDDGVIEPGEDLPNDFYIRNDDTSTSVVLPADGADFALLLLDGQGSPVETSVSYDELVDALTAESPDVYGVVDGVIPAMVTIDDGVIVSISQVYLP